jgi:hypothetical protein
MSSALMARDVKVFRHEFSTIFRYSHAAAVHPADVHVLSVIDDRCTLYEEDKGTVFLARDVIAQLQKLTAAAKGPKRGPYMMAQSRMQRPRAGRTRLS